MPAYSIKQMPVKITVNTTISNDDGKETYELITFGQYIRKIGSTYLRYEEVMEEGTIQTIVKMGSQGQEGSILRKGPIDMRLSFQKNKTLRGSYKTPLGNFHMKTSTSRITCEYNADLRKGEIDLLYDLSMQGSHAGTYHLMITFEEEKK